ncbi:MAG TPA: hypothetical protein VJ938_10970 [Acidimicrobiia bacterium]|nr:hypothetical protein [Acidimicrobiia bacterium]
MKSKRRPPVRSDIRVSRPRGSVNPADLISRLWYPLGIDRPERERRPSSL